MFALPRTLLVKLASSPAAARPALGMAFLGRLPPRRHWSRPRRRLLDAVGSTPPFLALAAIGLAILTLGVLVHPSSGI